MTNPITVENTTGEIVAAQVRASQNLLDVAQEYKIDCQELAEAAADDLGSIKAKMKELNELRLSMTRPLDESKKRIMELFQRPIGILELAETKLKTEISDWNRRERERLAAEQKVAREAAAKAAEEARLQAEAAAKVAQEASAEGDTTTAVQAQAEAEAAALAAEAIAHMSVPVATAPAKLSGVSSREDWKAEVVDLMALVNAVAAGEASIELIEANTKAIGQRAKALKSDFKVPGIRVYTVDTVSARAR